MSDEKKTAVVVVESKIKDLAVLAVAEGEEEHLNQDELEIPFLRIAQKGSPQVDEDAPEFIEGLKIGHYFNTVGAQSYGPELTIQVHGYYQNFTIWKGEKGNGEFNGTMTPEEFRAFESKNTLTRDGGDMVNFVEGEEFRYSDTRNFIVSLPFHSDDGIMIYPLVSTGIKAAKKWNTLQNGRRISGRPAKRYATIWEIKTAGFEGKGFTWKQTASVRPIGWATPDLLAYGQEFEDFVKGIKNQGVRYSGEKSTAEDSEF